MKPCRATYAGDGGRLRLRGWVVRGLGAVLGMGVGLAALGCDKPVEPATAGGVATAARAAWRAVGTVRAGGTGTLVACGGDVAVLQKSDGDAVARVVRADGRQTDLAALLVAAVRERAGGGRTGDARTGDAPASNGRTGVGSASRPGTGDARAGGSAGAGAGAGEADVGVMAIASDGRGGVVALVGGSDRRGALTGVWAWTPGATRPRLLVGPEELGRESGLGRSLELADGQVVRCGDRVVVVLRTPGGLGAVRLGDFGPGREDRTGEGSSNGADGGSGGGSGDRAGDGGDFSSGGAGRGDPDRAALRGTVRVSRLFTALTEEDAPLEAERGDVWFGRADGGLLLLRPATGQAWTVDERGRATAMPRPSGRPPLGLPPLDVPAGARSGRAAERWWFYADVMTADAALDASVAPAERYPALVRQQAGPAEGTQNTGTLGTVVPSAVVPGAVAPGAGGAGATVVTYGRDDLVVRPGFPTYALRPGAWCADPASGDVTVWDAMSGELFRVTVE